MKISQIYTESPLRNFTYIVSSEEAPHVICVDPYYPQQIMDFLEKHQLKLTHIINTHEHHDHTMGNEELQNLTGAKIWAQENTRGTIPNVDKFLQNNETWDWGPGEKIEFIHTPGHTNGHLTMFLHWDGEGKAVITGDTLFNAGVGHCKMGGNVPTLYETISSFFYSLSDDILVYPGHEYWVNNLKFTLKYDDSLDYAHELLAKCMAHEKSGKDFIVSTIGIEKKINLFFRLREQSLVQNIMKQDEGSSDKDVFIKLRKLRDVW